MKEQYVADVNDYRKYALLRALSGNGELATGVCWMLTPPDNRADGNKTGYLMQPHEWENHDPLAFQALRQAQDKPLGQRLNHIEESGILPNTRFFSEALPDKAEPRQNYFERMRAHFHDVDLVFLDPDIGLEVASKPKGRAGSSQYLFLDEVADIYQGGHSLLIYQHFPREVRSNYIRRARNRLADVAWGTQVRAFDTAHVLFLLLVHPKHVDRLGHEGLSIRQRWPGTFLRCCDEHEMTASTPYRQTAISSQPVV